MVNEQKLKAVIAYLAERTQLDKLKLFGLLYIADFTAFAKWGQSITGETYYHTSAPRIPELDSGCSDSVELK